MTMRLAVAASAVAFFLARAEEQVWDDNGPDNLWSTNAPNWAGGAVWTNGNSAVFSGAGGTLLGETVDVSATVTVANVTFQTNGYVIADADSDGTLSLAGGPSVINVTNAGDTGTVSEVIGGTGGFTKTGAGQLRLTSANTYFGQTIVSNGTLRLSPNVVGVLGATGTDAATYVSNATIVVSGATLDLNGCYASSGSTEAFQIAGAGVDGKGALVNYGADHVNKSVGSLTLLGDATVNSTKRIDANTVYGNGHTLTKIGAEQFCVGNLANAEIIISGGVYTLLNDNRALGGTTPGDSTLNAWNTMTVSERITFNGGYIVQGNSASQQFTLTGYLTLNSNVTANTGASTSGLEISGYVDGSGGFTQGNAGWCYITGDTNTYSGPTIINSSRTLWVGKTNLYSGVLGTGTVTNNGTLNGYSRRISDGTIVNMGGASLNVYTGSLGAASTVNSGTLYLRGGEIGTGTVVNSGNIVCFSPAFGGNVITNNGGIYFDRAGTAVSTNQIFGTGSMYVRYGCDAVLSAASATNYALRVAAGSMTLTNGARLIGLANVYVADRGVSYAYTLTNANAKIDVCDGASLTAKYIVMGDGANVSTGLLAGVINQYNGQVTTYDCTAESNGVRVAHWPQADCVYNMMGGTLTVDNGWDFCIATDGTGWVHQAGGEIYTSRMMLNERGGAGGFGRLTVEGGVLNIGLTSGVPNVVANGISVDSGAPYLAEYGGMGGVIRAVTNFVSSLNATLYGAGTNAITFDTKEWLISLSGRMSGAGGLNKAGSGTLSLSGNNTYSGETRVGAGTLLLTAADALTNTAVTVESGARVDLGGLTQKLWTLAGEGAVTNGSLKVSGAIAPGTNSIGTLTLAGVGGAAPGGTLTVDVTTNGASDAVAVLGDLDLTGMTLQVADAAQLNTHQDYTIATFTGSLIGSFAANNLSKPWYVLYDRAGGTVQLRSENGTLIRVN